MQRNYYIIYFLICLYVLWLGKKGPLRGPGSEGSEGSKGRFLRWTGPMGRRVLKFDGAFGPEGCGIALSGDEYKVSVTGLAFCVIWHDKHSGDWLTAFATPYPGCAGLPPVQGAE